MILAGIVLAAGAGTRFGGDKLTAPFRGEPLIRHAIRAARAAPVERVIVVGSPGLAIGDWPGPPPVEVLRIVSDSLSVSLKAGLAVAGAVDGAFIFLGDMPLIPHDLSDRLAAALGNSFAAVPRQGGKNGHPVLLSDRAFAVIAELTGDQGAGKLLKARGDVAFVDWPSDAIHRDVDRIEDLDRLEQR